jgi:hypothetical protein
VPAAGGQLVLLLTFQSGKLFVVASAAPEVIVVELLGGSRCPAQLTDHLHQVTIHGQIVQSNTKHFLS